jgi:ADP-ribosyl-[dinitrogen reductase] hydrolase
MMDLLERFRGCLLGLAVGDAVGTAVEFQPRGSFRPLGGMQGGGPFNLKPGQWTDDTSMALCLAASLVETGGFDARDQLLRYDRWFRQGYYSCTGRCFDIGATVRDALLRFRENGDPFSGSTDPYSAGNGSIMRLAPVPMFYYPDREQILRYCAESSRTTHGAQECLDACRLLGDILWRAFEGAQKQDILLGGGPDLVMSPAVRAIAAGKYMDKPVSALNGSGYVVKSLEAALWCFWVTDSYDQAVLRAANLGDDADTTAAICGQVAGAYYGEPAIPPEWLELLAMKAEIADLAERLCRV